MPIRPREKQTRNTVGESDFVEVDQESQWDLQQLHVADELRLMNRRDFPHSLQLYQQTRFDQDVELQALLKHDTLVLDPDVLLFDGAQALQLEFAHEAFLIDAFQQPGPEGPVDFDGSSDDFATQAIRPFEV